MIRKIRYSDIESINSIVKDYDKKFTNHYKITNYIDNNVYLMLVYVEHAVIKGFVISTIICGELNIQLVFIDIKYRRKGIAKRLMQETINNSNCNRAILEVSVENDGALSLYYDLGFKVIDTRKKYYDGIDAYVMEKVIE